jgi:hypothetical protein
MSQRMLIASCLAIGMIGRLEFKPIHDTDIFWQVRLGQIMLEEHRIPTEDRFTYTHAGEPAPPIYWLAQAIFASVHGTGGWRLTRLVHHCAFVGALLAAAATCRPRSTTPFSTAVAMTIGFLVMLSNADLRPQSFALASFAILLAVARSDLSFKNKLMIAVPLVVAWQNMHPSVVLGAVALAGLTAADFVDPLRTRTDRWQLVVLTVLAACAQFATPLHAGVLAVAQTNLRISRDILHLGEWGPPWDPKVALAVSPYWIALFGSLAAVVWSKQRIAPRDLALVIVMTALSLYAARFIIFWAVALVPFWAALVEQILPPYVFSFARDPAERSVRTGRSILCLLAGATIVLGIHLARFQPIFEREIPLDGVRVLRASLPGAARIYNDYVWAGPLILEGSPGWRFAIDGRLYFFANPAEWRSINEARAGRTSIDELEQTHHPDAFFLYRADSIPLINALSACPRWRICFSGPTCVAFVRGQ